MKSTLKNLPSKRVIAVVLVVVLALSILNTYMILEGKRQTMSTNPINYEYVLSADGDYKLKNMHNGYVTNYYSASEALNNVFLEGKSVFLNTGTYALTENVTIKNKLGAKIVGNDVTIQGNGNRIWVFGDNYTTSQSLLVSGIYFVNCTVRVENSFGSTIEDSKFANSTAALEFANTNTWSEYNKVENCQFFNNTAGIVFRTPVNGTRIGSDTGNATGSYASSVIDRCTFNLLDFSVGISVERLAEFSDSQILNTRFWMGENEVRSNQTALIVDGSMYQTLLQGVVFESFANNPIYMFAVEIGPNCDPAPIFGSGVSFLGNWTARVHNQEAIWLSADGTIFSRIDEVVPVGTSGQYGSNISIQCKPLRISEFKPKITVDGSFGHNETVTVRVRIEFLDNSVSGGVTKTFMSAGSQWLSDDDVLALFPSQSVIWQILIDAKASSVSTDTSVKVSGYGVAQ